MIIERELTNLSPSNVLARITVGRLQLTTYRGSPWLGLELMRRCFFVTLFGRRFEWRWLKTKQEYLQIKGVKFSPR